MLKPNFVDYLITVDKICRVRSEINKINFEIINCSEDKKMKKNLRLTSLSNLEKLLKIEINILKKELGMPVYK